MNVKRRLVPVPLMLLAGAASAHVS